MSFFQQPITGCRSQTVPCLRLPDSEPPALVSNCGQSHCRCRIPRLARSHRSVAASYSLLLLLITFASSICAASGHQQAAVDFKLAYYEDSSNRMSIASIIRRQDAFTESSNHNPNFGFSQSTYWIRLQVAPQPASRRQLVLRIAYPHLDELHVYQQAPNGTFTVEKLGDKQRYDDRLLQDRAFAIPVNLPSQPQETLLLLRVRSAGSVQIPVQMLPMSAYHSRDHHEQLLLGFYYGILLGVLLYNMLLAAGTRESVYVFYCGYVAAYGFAMFSLNGLAYEYLWSDANEWQQIATPFLIALSLTFSLRFSHLFLGLTAKTYPVMHQGTLLFSALALAMAPLMLLIPPGQAIKTAAMASGLGALYMFALGLYCFKRGNPNAQYFLAAWSILLLGVTIYALKTWGLLPENFFTEYAVQIGSAFEMIVLSYALADRFNKLRAENDRIQAQAKATLETAVQQRTQDLRDAMMQLETANTQLESLSRRDALTGLFNRRYFNEMLDPVLARAHTQNSPVSILMIDIDHFKAINDTWGHLVGDDVIRTVADVVNDMAVGDDCIPARFGGEEFVLLMPGFDRNEIAAHAELLRKRIEASSFTIDTTQHADIGTGATEDAADAASVELEFTASVGMATERSANLEKAIGLELLERADQALYVAKKTGRNRCSSFNNASDPDSLAA